MSGKINFSLIREASRNELVKLLDGIPGPKVNKYKNLLN